MNILPRSFYTHDDVVSIAQNLLGKVLITNIQSQMIECRIVETEAYKGPEDRASHTYNNKLNHKNKVMYEQGGIAYIYISYGMHHMLNVVTSKKGNGHAVLIRAVEPLTQLPLLQERRNIKKENYLLTGGPGKICQALQIDKSYNHTPLFDKNSAINIWDDGYEIGKVMTTPRVGMSHHVGAASHWPWRFYLTGNVYVSKPLAVTYNW